MQVIENFLSKLAAAIFRAFEAVINLFLDLFWSPLEKFVDKIFEKWARGFSIGSLPGERAMVRYGAPKTIFDHISDDLNKLPWHTKILGVIAYTGIALGAYVQSIMSVIGQRVLHTVNKLFLPTLPSFDEAMTAWYRDRITHSAMVDIGQAAGLHPTHIDMLKTVKKPLLAVTEIRDATLRKILSDDDATRLLSYHGFDPLAVNTLKQLFFYLPPPPDLIRMAVREVFSPAIAQQYGLFEDFPEEFARFAEMQGLNREWAIRYWAAHWDLPSIQMGFEMLHRGIISQSDLEILLRALDIMPFWRDKLVKMSYRPFTRVDVRRMYQTGVLDVAGVKKSYLDLGYDEEKASQMTEFTLRFATTKERDITKTDILGAFQRNLVDQNFTKQALVNMGYSPPEADFYITRALYDREMKKKKQLVGNVKKRFERGIIDENEVIKRLSEANLPAAEIYEYLEVWRASRGTQVFSPPLGDLKALLRDRIITESEFRDEMVKKGTSEVYISWYLKQARERRAS